MICINYAKKERVQARFFGRFSVFSIIKIISRGKIRVVFLEA